MHLFHHDVELTLEELCDIAKNHTKVGIAASTIVEIKSSRSRLDKYVADGRIIYGVNTSLGGFVDRLVPLEKAQALQENLIKAVATNVGQYFDDVTVRAIMLARINSLCRANSAIRIETLNALIDLYNSDIVPCIPQKGSLGTSGDLGPLANIALVCCGMWKCSLRGNIVPAKTALQMEGLEPVNLAFKDGLALINGTSAMTGLASLTLVETRKLLDTYLQVSALSFEGLNALSKPFEPAVHRLKPHLGQQFVARKITDLLVSSNLIAKEDEIENDIQKTLARNKESVEHPIEDAYSIRCTPQILGPVFDSLEYNSNVVQNELNSSNDNPLILPGEEGIYHNGHFHGQYVAMSMDFMSISLVTISNLSNRRIDRFMDESNSNGLPPFLCDRDQGLRLGLMGGQFMSASLTAENRSLCVPLSIQSLTTTADFQDIVSFGLVAARRSSEILQNTKYVVAFELLAACQAIDIRGALGLSNKTRPLYERVRKIAPFQISDEIITDYLEEIVENVL